MISRTGVRRRLATGAVLGFWLATTAWLIRYEGCPHRFARHAAGYKSLFSDVPLIVDEWMNISHEERRIGYSHTQITSETRDADEQYIINNSTFLNLKIMGQPQRVRVAVFALLNTLYELEHFKFSLSSRAYHLAITGDRVEGRVFDVSTRTGESLRTTRVEIPEEAVLYSPMVEMALRRLKPGQRMSVRTFNPVTLTAADVVVKALRRDTIQHAGKRRDVTVLSADFEGMEVLTWMDDGGRILRQQTPFGWQMEACTFREALAAEPAEEAPDILFALRVPSTREIQAPRTRERLRVRLRGGDFREETLSSHRQAVSGLTETAADLTLDREQRPSAAPAIGAIPAAYGEFLEASPFVQSDAPEVIRRSRAITGTQTNSLLAALAIHEWVYRQVRKEPTVSVPSALDVLGTMAGDCNEHTTLFVALARAAGIPAKITVGLTYHEGAFYYHAWPAVFVGRWLEMDPTLGQAAVDATHIKLLEGELPDQLKLMKLLGRLSVEVLDEG